MHRWSHTVSPPSALECSGGVRTDNRSTATAELKRPDFPKFASDRLSSAEQILSHAGTKSMREQDGKSRVGQNVAGGTAEDDLAEPALRVGAL